MDERARFERLTALFDTIVSLDPAERPSAVEQACGDDEALAAELRQMLSHDAGDDDRPDRAWALIRPAAEALAGGPAIGQTVSSWRILSLIGEGGMGSVYLAERADGEFESKVAIKFVHDASASPERARRFRAERQILARLSHPGIARLLDGGTTDDGVPFLVMELVDGETITRWSEERALSVRARVELFLQVCDAVTAAHQSLVAHLDLKPSNILVDDGGTMKLLDFGVARLIGEDEGDTLGGAPGRLMTPTYASPEQIRGEPAGTAADVYSLGVLLFELLTKRLPVEREGRSLSAWLEALGRQQAPPPSTVVTGHARRQLRGGLDAIVAKALHNEARQRYGSVQRLADDLRRHLDGHAVTALAGATAYRATRFVRRNIVPVAAAVLVIGGSLGFARYASLQARALETQRDQAQRERETAQHERATAQQERAIAQRERATAQQVSLFLQRLLTEADPNEGSGPDVTIRELVDRGVRQLDSELQEEPEIRAALSLVVGRVYRNWGELDAARPLLDAALDLRSNAANPDPLALAHAELERAALAYDRGEYPEAHRLLELAIARNEAAANGSDAFAADATTWMTVTLSAEGDLDKAKALGTRALAMAEAVHSRPHRDIANAMVALVDILTRRGEWDEAEPLAGRAVEDLRALYPGDHLEVAHALNHRSQARLGQNRPAEALEDARESLRMRRAVLGGPHVEIGASLGSIAGILVKLGRLAEAETVRRESLAEFREALGTDAHIYVVGTTSSLGVVLLEQDKYAEAETVLRRAIALHRELEPPAPAHLATSLVILGSLLTQRDRAGEAEGLLVEGLRLRQEGLPEGHWLTGLAHQRLGEALDVLERPKEAETHLLKAHELLVEALGKDNEQRVAPMREVLAEHYRRRGLDDDAARFSAPP